jgi:hypothetical protein
MSIIFTDTICALATPPGIGGLAVLRLSGPKAVEIAEHLISPRGRGDKRGAGDSAQQETPPAPPASRGESDFPPFTGGHKGGRALHPP